MGMPVAPTYAQDGWRARTNVTDPTGINTAFDAGDAAKDADWSQSVDTLFRVRFVVKQTTSTANVTGDLATEFLLQYNNTTAGSGWVDVGAVGGDTEDVQYIAASGFANHDNTTKVIGAGSFVTGDGLEAAGATDTITFSTEALSETEIEVALEIVGAQVANNDTIDLRFLWSNTDEAPPATTMSYTAIPTITVVKGASEFQQELFVEPTLSVDVSRSYTGYRTLFVTPTATVDLAKSLVKYVILDVPVAITATLGRAATLARTLFVEPTASPSVSRQLTASRTLPVDVTATSTLARLASFARTLVTTPTATPSITASRFSLQELVVTVTNAVDLALLKTYSETLAIASTVSATLTRQITYRQVLDVAVTAAVSFRKAITKTLAVAMTAGVAIRRAMSQTLAVAASMTLALTDSAIFSRTLPTVATFARYLLAEGGEPPEPPGQPVDPHMVRPPTVRSHRVRRFG